MRVFRCDADCVPELVMLLRAPQTGGAKSETRRQGGVEGGVQARTGRGFQGRGGDAEGWAIGGILAAQPTLGGPLEPAAQTAPPLPDSRIKLRAGSRCAPCGRVCRSAGGGAGGAASRRPRPPRPCRPKSDRSPSAHCRGRGRGGGRRRLIRVRTHTTAVSGTRCRQPPANLGTSVQDAPRQAMR